jgi:glutamate dehydrogenase
MGITAKGAWEAVKRHFRELGKDIQSEPFTVVGVGDMSGDVFGNGMLLSKAIRLVAAFDHRDIFLDPNPDPAKSWAERKRLFDLPRSSWQDYDKVKISKGGGVFSRSLKAVPLSDEIRALLGVEDQEMVPTDLIRAILKAEVELLYFGGIGAYVRARTETDLDVGDKANDAVRVSADQLRVKVVGEGANLGVTQAGRIAYARLGGRINTDAIDNSAGVDTSDHEVNIKILTGQLERRDELDRPGRNKLLTEMTDSVGAHVLQHNYDQTLALSLQQARAPQDLDAHSRFMIRLEGLGRLDRQVEGLPAAAAMADLAAGRQGLTRPELAVVMAYGKLELAQEIEASAAPEDPWFETTLKRYFPEPLWAFEPDMRRHRLRREIIATVLANEIVNIAGPTFPERLRQAANCDTATLVTAFEAARQVFRIDEGWGAVSALDLKIPAAAQTLLYSELALVMRRQAFWIARRPARGQATVAALVKAYQPAADVLRTEGPAILSEFEQGVVNDRAQAFVAAGAPEALARSVAALRPLISLTDIADLAERSSWPLQASARLYIQVGAVFGFDRLRAAAGGLSAGDYFDRMAVRRLIEDLMAEQSELARAVAAASPLTVGANGKAARQAVQAFISGPRAPVFEQVKKTMDEIEQSGQGWSFAKLTIANAALRELAAAA